MTELAVKEGGTLARPLNVLVPLIKDDFEKADEAGVPYFRAAGEKLTEARQGNFEGKTAEFFNWAEKTFGKKKTQIRTYMSLAAAPGSFQSIEHFKRLRGHSKPIRTHRDWTIPVDAVAERARDEARRLALEDSLTRRQEQEADHKLALRLIDIGFKVLARELHPDKGGSREAMARLSRVRNRLKECI